MITMHGNPNVVDPLAPLTHHHHRCADDSATPVCPHGAVWENGFYKLNCLGDHEEELYDPCHCTCCTGDDGHVLREVAPLP